MRVPVRKQGKLSGFTLVEMAIVLVIIGIILAGVMKGRDIVRSAQAKEFAQSFGNKWVTLTQTYYDKIGQHLTDGSNNAGTNTIANGIMDGNRDPGTTAADKDWVLLYMQNAGVDPCTNIKTIVTGYTPAAAGGAGTAKVCERTKDPFIFEADTEALGRVKISVSWGAFTDTADGTRLKNYVSLTNCPLELAKALDTLIDGEADGQQGFGLYLGNTASFSSTTPLTAFGYNGNTDAPEAFPTAQDAVVEFHVVLDY